MPELLNEETWESWSYYFGEDEKLSFASVEFTVTVRYCTGGCTIWIRI